MGKSLGLKICVVILCQEVVPQSRKQFRFPPPSTQRKGTTGGNFAELLLLLIMEENEVVGLHKVPSLQVAEDRVWVSFPDEDLTRVTRRATCCPREIRGWIGIGRTYSTILHIHTRRGDMTLDPWKSCALLEGRLEGRSATGLAEVKWCKRYVLFGLNQNSKYSRRLRGMSESIGVPAHGTGKPLQTAKPKVLGNVPTLSSWVYRLHNALTPDLDLNGTLCPTTDLSVSRAASLCFSPFIKMLLREWGNELPKKSKGLAADDRLRPGEPLEIDQHVISPLGRREGPTSVPVATTAGLHLPPPISCALLCPAHQKDQDSRQLPAVSSVLLSRQSWPQRSNRHCKLSDSAEKPSKWKTTEQYMHLYSLNDRTTEWMKLHRTSEGPVQPQPTPLLKQGHLEPVAQDRVQTAFEYLQGWRLHKLPGQSVPLLSQPHSKKVFPDVQREPPVFSLCPLPLVLSLGTMEKSLAPSSLHRPFRPWILCIPDSKTLRVDLEPLLALSARGSSRRISLWMGIRKFRLVRYRLQCTIVVAIGSPCSSTLSNTTTEGSSERPGKGDSCFISSIAKAAIPKAHHYPFGSLKYPLLSIANELAHDDGALHTKFRHMGLVHWTSSGSLGYWPHYPSIGAASVKWAGMTAFKHTDVNGQEKRKNMQLPYKTLIAFLVVQLCNTFGGEPEMSQKGPDRIHLQSREETPEEGLSNLVPELTPVESEGLNCFEELKDKALCGCMRAQGTCAQPGYWWDLGHGAASASPPSGCWIQPPLAAIITTDMTTPLGTDGSCLTYLWQPNHTAPAEKAKERRKGKARLQNPGCEQPLDALILGWNIMIITESQNRIGWKRPLRSSSPTVNLTLPSPPLHHVPKHLIQTSFKYLQGWRLNHFPGQPVPVLDNPFSEEKFPNIQSKPPLAQFEAISSCPITCYLGEETNPHLSTTSFQVAVESDKVSPQPPFLQAKQSQLPQPLLIRLLLQTLHQLRRPSLDTLQHLNVSLVVGGPKLNTVFEVRPHQCRVQGHNHCPSPSGHAIFDTSQDAIGFLGRLGTLLAHIQAAVNRICLPSPVQMASSRKKVSSFTLPSQLRIRFLKAPSIQTLNPFSDGASITSVGNLFPYLTTLIVKKFFLMSNLNLPSFSLKPLALVLPPQALVMISFLGCKHTLPAYVHFFIHQYPLVLLHRAALNPFIPQPVLILGVAPSQVQDLALGLVEPHEVLMGSLFKPVKDACPCFHCPCISFLHLSSARGSLLSHASLLPSLPDFLHMRIKSSWALRKMSLKSFQNEFHQGMITAAQVATNLYIPN
ncbi:hypothetical protein QYF61_026113 [Mycteria americana]|uniref:Uncharacterized protein n=1 Tax=Mycteria americana TaxID=33587 RepID=A0AAN7NLX1_MYCAM|nr:hypothetical protein QYF61_026113 [Mycteria americana]